MSHINRKLHLVGRAASSCKVFKLLRGIHWLQVLPRMLLVVRNFHLPMKVLPNRNFE